jgi:GR25 family glycosyltransferase involved in LPS biosynthesis
MSNHNAINSISDIKHAFYINLEARTDRKAHVEEQLASIGITAERFNAIKLSKGAIGCSVSHLKCLEIASKNSFDHVLICEDDITFLDSDLFICQLNKCLSTLSKNSHTSPRWDVIMFGGNNVPPYKIIDDSCIKISRCLTTTGYLVNGHYINTLIANIKEGINNYIKQPTMGSSFAIDTYWNTLQKKDNWFLVTPLTVIQQEGYSDIEQKDVNYTKLMTDIDKPYLLRRL